MRSGSQNSSALFKVILKCNFQDPAMSLKVQCLPKLDLAHLKCIQWGHPIKLFNYKDYIPHIRHVCVLPRPQSSDNTD